MLLEEGPECCVDQELCREYTKLLERKRQLQPNRRRIKFLALPKYTRPRFRPPYHCYVQRKTDIFIDPPVRTRTEQLAYPYVRRLLLTQKDYAHILHPARLGVLNRMIRKSVLSLYSRLANVQAPRTAQPVIGWTKKDWAVHRQYLKQLAQPKRKFYPERGPRMWKELNLMKRLRKLAKPRIREEFVMPKWEFTPALKNYKASQRILQLSQPRENLESPPQPAGVSPAALLYKPTERIKQLATPPEVRLGESDLKENPFGISPNALKAKASERIVELAEPKEYTDTHTRPNAFAISPAALKAKPTARIIELAKPKGS